MSIQTKRRVLFAMLMGVITTGIITFSVLALDQGVSSALHVKWLKAWVMAYALVIPIILIIGPKLQGWVERMVR